MQSYLFESQIHDFMSITRDYLAVIIPDRVKKAADLATHNHNTMKETSKINSNVK